MGPWGSPKLGLAIAAQSVAKFTELSGISFVVLKEHVERFGIDRKILGLYPGASITVIPEVLPGAVLTCMEGCRDIPDGTPVLFNDCDHLFLCKGLYDFCRAGCPPATDAALLTFRSRDPRFSFAELSAEGFVTRTVEKKP